MKGPWCPGGPVPAQFPHALAPALPHRAALQYHQVFEELLRTMHPAATAELLQAKTFLASFPCPS